MTDAVMSLAGPSTPDELIRRAADAAELAFLTSPQSVVDAVLLTNSDLSVAEELGRDRALSLMGEAVWRWDERDKIRARMASQAALDVCEAVNVMVVERLSPTAKPMGIV